MSEPSYHPQAIDTAQPAKIRGIFGLSSGGAVLAAMLASACCWLPFVLAGAGISAVGIAGAFDALRPLLLVAAVLGLGIGFYMAYFRKPICEPASACAEPRPHIRQLNRVLLWMATVLVFAFALLPYYIGLIF